MLVMVEDPGGHAPHHTTFEEQPRDKLIDDTQIMNTEIQFGIICQMSQNVKIHFSVAGSFRVILHCFLQLLSNCVLFRIMEMI